MKKKMICPKCGSTDIVRIDGKDDRFKRIRLNSENEIFMSKYLCQNCNYSEEWVDTKEDIEKLKKIYSKYTKKKV